MKNALTILLLFCITAIYGQDKKSTMNTIDFGSGMTFSSVNINEHPGKTIRSNGADISLRYTRFFNEHWGAYIEGEYEYNTVKRSRYFGKVKSLDAEVVETAIGLDRYLRASNEDKVADTEFYGMVSDYGDGTYGVRSKVKNISFIVATEDKSIWDNDAQWQFANISYYDHYSGADTYVEYHFNLQEGPTLNMEPRQDSTWTFKVEDKVTSHVRLMKSDSLYCWRVVASCKEEAKNGMSSVASTTSEGIIMRKVWEGAGTSYPYKKNSFNGKFITEISRDNEQVDYCIINFRPGFTPAYTTSRDE